MIGTVYFLFIIIIIIIYHFHAGYLKLRTM
jgi:hypothetical protein